MIVSWLDHCGRTMSGPVSRMVPEVTVPLGKRPVSGLHSRSSEKFGGTPRVCGLGA